MTPIIIPLAEQCDWKNHESGETHQELKYLICSAVEYVQDPLIIVVGHRPDWLEVGRHTRHGITNSVEIVHLEAYDDQETNKDANMIHKVALGCKHLLERGHTGGFIRASDDQLFLAPYEPCVYSTGWIRQYILEEVARANKNKGFDQLRFNHLVSQMSDFKKRLYATGEFYESGPIIFDYKTKTDCTALNFDCHVPQWYLSPQSFIEVAQQGAAMVAAGVTINSFYLNAVEKQLREQLGDKYIRYPNNAVIMEHGIDIDLRMIGLFRKDVARASFLSYNAKAIKDRSGTLKRYIVERFKY